MSDQGYEDDRRTVDELRAEWKAGPTDDDPKRELPSGASVRYSLPRLGEVRGALFAKLHTPESIRKPKARKT